MGRENNYFSPLHSPPNFLGSGPRVQDNRIRTQLALSFIELAARFTRWTIKKLVGI